MSDRGVVDIHTHYVPPSLVRAFEQRTEPPRIFEGPSGRLLQYGDRMARPISPEMIDLGRKLEKMDEDGIGFAVLTVNIPGVDWFPAVDAASIARDANDELIEAARAHPDRLAALATLPSQIPDQAASELKRAVSLGLRGAHIYSNVAGRSLDEPSFRVLFDTAAALGVPLSLHPTYPLCAAAVDAYALVPVLGYLVDSTTAVLRLVLDGLYERHPDFKLVLAHAGSLIPYLVGRIDYESTRTGLTGALSVPPSEQLRLVYTDHICVWPPALRLAVDFFGGEKVMFGTDQPFWDPKRAFDTLAAAELPEQTVTNIESANAVTLFGL